MTGKGNVIFRYKTIRGPLHGVPALVKLLLLLPLSIFCMSLPSFWLAVGIGAAVIIAFLCRFTIREQLTDLKPAVYYAALMYALSIFSNLIPFPSSLVPNIFIPNVDFIRITLRLTLIIQISALLFRTTSSIEIRDALRVGKSIALFLSFIPEIFTTWAAVNLAWKARGGKNGLYKIRTTIFILIVLSMEKAVLKAKALEARNFPLRR